MRPPLATTRSRVPGWSRAGIAGRLAHLVGRRVSALVLAVALIAAAASGAGAEAPPLATALADVELRVGPGAHYPVVTVIPAGTEVVLTGKAKDEFVGVIYGPYSQVWAEASYLDAGHLTNGIILATATVDVTMHAAPFPDGEILQIVPAGSSLIITGATVGDYIAASYNGIGGWVLSPCLE